MEGWIENTSKMPVAAHTKVDVAFADGDVVEDHEAGYWIWQRVGAKADITHWRLHKQKDEFVEVPEVDDASAWMSNSSPLAGQEFKVQPPDTNPKRSLGLQSVPLHLWSDLASAYGALALYDGAGRYGTNNYKATKVDASIYLAAARRHIASWSEGEECDPVTGVPHLGAVLANVAILLEARAAGTLVDDRNIGTGWLQERDNLKEIVKQVAKANEGREPRHYTRKEN